MNKEKAIKQLAELKRHGKDMRLAAEKWHAPWNVLVAIIMSARTNDYVTIPVANKLFSRYSSVEKLALARLGEVEKIIRPVNFYKNKARNVTGCAKMLVFDFGGKVPLDFDELIKLPGVGRKTANVFLAEMGGDNIGVDTHVGYISYKLGWTSSKKPERVEEDLKKLFPRKYWKKINSILVRFGKTHTSRRKEDALLDKIKKR